MSQSDLASALPLPVRSDELLSRLAVRRSAPAQSLSLPGPSDHGCCGSRPGQASHCAGPGTCCGKAGA